MATRTTAAGKAGSRGGSIQAPSGRAEPLRRCADVCQETTTYCLERGGEHANVELVRCLIDTAETCMLAANAVARESEHTKDVLALCADVCGCTAEACAELEDDAQMRACEEACRAAVDFALRA